MTKQLTAVFLSAVLLTGTASAAAWPTWAGDAENWAREHGLSDAFLAAPANQLTRAETARLLYEAAGTPSAGDSLPFDDVPAGYADAVAWTAGQGYINGVGGGKF